MRPEADRSTSTRSLWGEEIIFPLGVLSGSVSGSIKRGEVLSSYGLALTRVAVAVLRSGGSLSLIVARALASNACINKELSGGGEEG